MMIGTTEQQVKFMEKEQGSYTSYLLRLWPTISEEILTWRASLEHPGTGERQGFASMEDLFAFLKEQTKRISEGGDPSR